ANLCHPHIVTVFAVGTHEGRPYLALEYLEGQNLRQRMVEQRPGVRESLRIVLAIAQALVEAHRHQVLHRDLKPENVVLAKDGRLRLVDLGLAKIRAGIAPDRTPERGHDRSRDGSGSEASDGLSGEDAARGRLSVPGPSVDAPHVTPRVADDFGSGTARYHVTVAGTIQGTPAYMAPEQWRSEECSEATDVWAVGVILHELLVGRRPYQGKAILALGHVVAEPQPVPALVPSQGISAEMVDLVGRCLAKDARERPSAAQVVDALERLLGEGDGRRQVGVEQSPFRGLFPFSERHADLFFGRDSEIAIFLESLREQAVVPVVGPSGAGKSSFVKAGVIPRLREQGAWTALTLRPGADPFAVLASRLMVGESARRVSEQVASIHSSDLVPPGIDGDMVGRAGGQLSAITDEQSLAKQLVGRPETLGLMLHDLAVRERCKVLLFVDQLEEVFTMVADGMVRDAFVRAICAVADHPSSPVRAVFTIRDDFLGFLEGGAEVVAALARVFVLRRPGREALAEVLTRPLTKAGYAYDDPSLVSEMVESVRDEPACLPLLQFACQMLWDRRDKDKRLLCRSTYQAMGGVAGSLAEHADGVLAGMATAQVELARQLLLRLVTSAGTRRVVPVMAAVAGLGPGVEAVLEKLTQARLLMVRRAGEAVEHRQKQHGMGGNGGQRRGAFGGDSGGGGGETVLELVHESLVRAWGRLARWLEESHEERAVLAEVEQAAELWHQRGRRDDEVWHGDALADARRRLARLATKMPEQVGEFLEAGLRRERRRRLHKRALLVVAMAAMAVAAAVSLLVARRMSEQRHAAEAQRRLAETERERAEQREAEAKREGSRAAFGRGDMLEARAKLRASLETSDSTMGRALWGQVQEEPLVLARSLGAGWVDGIAYAADGKTVAAVTHSDRVFFVDTETAAFRMLRMAVGLASIALSPDGKYLALGTGTGPVLVLDLAQGSTRELVGHRNVVFGLAFDTSSRLLASGSTDTNARLWDVESGRELAVLRGHQMSITRLAFGAAEVLFTASKDGTVRQWDSKTGASRVVVKMNGPVYGIAVDHSGDELITGGIDRTIRRWKIETGEELAVLHGHLEPVISIALSPDRRTLASSSTDGTVMLWGRYSGRHVVLGRHEGAAIGVAMSPDGRSVASAGFDGTVRLWQVRMKPDRTKESGHTGVVHCLAFSPDGSLLGSGAEDSTLRTWDVRTGRQRALLQGHRGTITGVAFSTDGTTVASSSHDRDVRLWNVASGTSEELRPRHGIEALDVAFDSAGNTLVSSGSDGLIRIWDVRSQMLRGELRGEAVAGSLTLSRDGATIAAAARNGTAYVWDQKAARVTAKLPGHGTEAWGVAFAADGGSLVASGYDGVVRRWDLARRTATILGKHDAQVGRLAISPDGKLLGTPCYDGTVRLWDMASGEVKRELRGHRGAVLMVRFSPDSKLIASSSQDGTVRTWDTVTGRPFWRAPLLMLGSPPRVHTHEGWIELDEASERAGQDTPARGTPADGTPAAQSPEERAVPRRETGGAAASTGWRRAVAEEARIAAPLALASDGLCLLTYDGELQLWSMRTDRLLASESLANATQVAATERGCLALADGRALLLTEGAVSAVRGNGDHSDEGAHGFVHHELSSEATVLTFQGGRILVVSGKEALVFAEDGHEETRVPVERGVSALGLLGDRRLLVVGHDTGDIELLPISPGTSKPSYTFEETLPSAIERFSEGPRRTLMVGYSSGDLGVWSLENGKRLRHSKLHGPIVHLLVDSETSRLYAATELGDYQSNDMTTFYHDYCVLMRHVWESVPVVWENGMPVVRQPPHSHRCLAVVKLAAE
ncbi:MAG: serine/threonine-protein kinase, partial [Pseudomonadota bacterium]